MTKPEPKRAALLRPDGRTLRLEVKDDGGYRVTGEGVFQPLREGQPITGEVLELKHREGPIYDVETAFSPGGEGAPKSSTVGWSATLTDEKWAKAFGRPSADMVN